MYLDIVTSRNNKKTSDKNKAIIQDLNNDGCKTSLVVVL